MPMEDNRQQLVAYAESIGSACGLHLRYISGGNSSALPLIAAGKMPRRINHVRIGKGILLGCETLHRTAWPEASQDAFLLHAAVTELKEQRSVPLGATSEEVAKRPLPGGC
jgi:predicted amino acid racemase